MQRSLMAECHEGIVLTVTLREMALESELRREIKVNAAIGMAYSM